MRSFRVVPLAVLALLALGCASVCKDLTGFPKATCEVKTVVQQIEKYQPRAFATLNAAKSFLTPDVVARINKLEQAWPPLRASMDALVLAMESGQQGDVAGVVANAVNFYIDLSALVVECGGKALPGLPKTNTINARAT